MATSDISQITFKQEWYVGNQISFSGSPRIDDDNDFFESIIIDNVFPRINSIRLLVTPLAQSDSDNGIFYGGNYKPVIRDIEISGNLSVLQKNIIKNNFNAVISPEINGEDSYTLNVGPVAAVGAQEFTILIPYEENNIINNSPIVSVPFIEILTDSNTPDPTTLIISNNFLSIDAGTFINNIPVLSINPISTSSRVFIDRSSYKQSSPSLFHIEFTEDISGKNLLTIDNNPVQQPFNQTISSLTINNYVNLNYIYDITVSTNSLTANISRKISSIDNINNPGVIQDTSYLFGLLIPPGSTIDWDVVQSGGISDSLTISCERTDTSTYGQPIRFFNNSSSPNESYFNITFDATLSSPKVTLCITNGTAGANCLLGSAVTVNITSDMTYGDLANAILQAINSAPMITDYRNRYALLNFILFDPTYTNAKVIFDGQVTFQSQSHTNIQPGSVVSMRYKSPNYGTISATINDLPNKTLADIRNEITEAFVDLPFSFSFSYFPQEPIPVGATTPDEWLDLPASCLKNGSYSKNNHSSIDGILSNFPVGGIFENKTVIFSYGDYDTLLDLASAIESISDFANMSIVSTAGPNYETLDPSSFLNFSDNFTAESMSSDVSFIRVIAPDGTEASQLLDIDISGTVPLIDLCNQINSTFIGVFQCSVIQTIYNNINSSELIDDSINIEDNSPAIFNYGDPVPIQISYNLNLYQNLSDLVSDINSDWYSTYGILASLSEIIENNPEAIPTRLNDVSLSNISNSFALLEGNIHQFATPTAPRENVYLSYNITFATDPGEPSGDSGIQVALGGYSSKGVDYYNQSPNDFFEPNFNSDFSVSFNVTEADTIYLLLRTRKNLSGSIFESNVNDYTGVARFDNGLPDQNLIPFITSNQEAIDAWSESFLDGDVPTAIAVKGDSIFVNCFITDNLEQDSITVKINNFPSSINDFGFLAINRSNSSGSMTESSNGRVFGLVLDNRGFWDILIAPEAIISKSSGNGDFLYNSDLYNRTILDSDEGYDFSLNEESSLPENVRSGISLISVPGFPQVWVLRISREVKSYLASLRNGQPIGTSNGCSLDIDLFVRGRRTGIEGTCRVTVYYDVYCVFDTDLCDTFWNLKEPKEPAGPKLINNRLEFSYQSLIDCRRLEFDSDGINTLINVPILINVQQIPTFENGNGLLLIKSYYSQSIQSFYYPAEEDLLNLQFENCSSISDNAPLISALNKSALYLPNLDEPITDPVEIESLLATSTSYMYIKPAFQFPVDDKIKDCSEEEIVAIGIGYQFKNWVPGYREENVVLGIGMVLGSGVFAAPTLPLCYRYYYNQKKG